MPIKQTKKGMGHLTAGSRNMIKYDWQKALKHICWKPFPVVLVHILFLLCRTSRHCEPSTFAFICTIVFLGFCHCIKTKYHIFVMWRKRCMCVCGGVYGLVWVHNCVHACTTVCTLAQLRGQPQVLFLCSPLSWKTKIGKGRRQKYNLPPFEILT